MEDAGLEDAEHLERDQVYRVHLETAARGHSGNLDIEDTEESVDIPERSEIRSQPRGEQIRPPTRAEVLAEFWVRECLVELREKNLVEPTLLHQRDIESHLDDFPQEVLPRAGRYLLQALLDYVPLK